MANMETMIEKFISDNELNIEMKDPIVDLINGCFTDYVCHMASEWLTTPVSNKKESSSSSGTKSKKDKLENPSEATCMEDLKNCTSVILNEFCKENKLKIGGNKKNIMERVWRHIQGEGSDEDKGRGNKSKKEKAKKESHACFACNAKGVPCGLVANEEFKGNWFCFRHIDDAETIISNKGSEKKKNKKKVSSDDDEEESVDSEKKKKVTVKKSKKKEVSSDEEEEELVESE